ncbi:MAG TPA: tryptophan--tRNA ligase [Actinobacteria bacterium]|nr:tryptophan--tRNA ligase [Actinomycetota bacterium]
METNDTRRRVFSGVQPTGNVHLGNYLGAFRNWVALQERYETIYCIVDLHGMTVPYDPDDYRRVRLETAKVLLAIGVDPDRSLFYLQSQVPQHAELAWILGTITPTGALNRMTQYKDKLASGAPANLGLYSYPVLMAADILLFRAELVPVGEDQKQHLELTRDLAERFNHRFGETFPVPDPLIPETAARVMSLTDPTSKMSKSDPSEKSRILLLDSDEAILKKVKAAVTDSEPTVRYDTEAKPGISNLLEIMAACTGRSIDDLVAEYHDAGYGRFKEAVAEAIIETIAPIRTAYRRLDDREVARILAKGALDARSRAEALQAEVRAATGIDAF